jgi:hypothetical protein
VILLNRKNSVDIDVKAMLGFMDRCSVFKTPTRKVYVAWQTSTLTEFLLPFLNSFKLMLVHAHSFNISSLFPNYPIIRSYITKAIDRIIDNLQKNCTTATGHKEV